MKKFNFRSAFSVVLCAMLVFSVGFYTMAEPTTSYFSDKDEKSQDYAMKKLLVNFSDAAGNSIDSNTQVLNLQFDAATKFLDENERNNMFEHAARYYIFKVENSLKDENGEIIQEKDRLNAQIRIEVVDSVNGSDVQESAEFDKGLRYFIYEVSDFDEIADAAGVTELVDGVYVNQDESCVIKSAGKYFDSKLSEKLGEKLVGVTVDNSFDELRFLNTANKQIEHLEPGNSKTYCICFWVEYDRFIELDDVDNDNIRTVNYNVDVKLSAEQCDGSELNANA